LRNRILAEISQSEYSDTLLEMRKETLAMLLSRAPAAIRLNEHLEHEDGPFVFHHACKLGLEGIVSKRKDSRYSSGRAAHWIKLRIRARLR
jgi:bifunctional non-homologous end joining protein LigD